MNYKDVKRISDHFRRSLDTYENGALVQAEASDYLISLLSDFPEISYDKVLEVGCCTGKLTEQFCKKHDVTKLYINDLVAEFCQYTSKRVESLVDKVEIVSGDIEKANIPNELDLILSSSTFQWLKDFPLMAKRMSSAINDKGHLAFSLFGPGTMCQIKELIGVGLEYMTAEKIRDCLDVHFSVKEMKISHKTMYFTSPREVLRHIQQTGVGGVVDFRWTPKKLRNFELQYEKVYATDDGFPLDYASIFIIAQKKTISDKR